MGSRVPEVHLLSASLCWGQNSQNGLSQPKVASPMQVQSRLCQLYPDYSISRMPEGVLGASAAPIVANAPQHRSIP